MFTIELLGALLLLGGLVYMAFAAIRRGKMSDPAAEPERCRQADTGAAPSRPGLSRLAEPTGRGW